MDHILSDLSTMTRPSWVAPQAWLSFIELDKAVVRDTHVHVCVYCACVHGGMGRWCLHFIGNWRSTDFQEEKPEGTEGLTVV